MCIEMKPGARREALAILEKWIMDQYGHLQSESLTRENFLAETWCGITTLVKWNMGNPLIKVAIYKNCDFIVRIFVILSTQYGAYTAASSKMTFLKDFVGMLDKDLEQKALEASRYAQGDGPGSFFPELGRTFALINKIYAREESRLISLPPTPHHADTLYVLNYDALLEKNISVNEFLERLSNLDAQFKKVLALAKSDEKLAPRGANDVLH